MLLSFAIFLALFFPAVSFGQVIINEIMYDLPGSDIGREWVEVFNQGDEGVDLSSWYLLEGGVHHSLKIFAGENVVPSGGYAVIVDDPVKFLADWPDFSGSIFDSSFSLSNDGETLILKNSNKKEDSPLDEVAYTKDQGANGDGDSLQKAGDIWIAAAPTPGFVNSGGGDAGGDDTASGTAEQAGSEVKAEIKGATVKSLRAEMIYPKLTSVGAPVEFTARASGGDPKVGYRFFWIAGDGASGFGPVWPHTYEFPGIYNVVLKTINGFETVVLRKTIEVVEPQITVEAVTDNQRPHILLSNKTGKEINLGGFQISTAGQSFIFPADTFVAANGRLRLSSTVTGFTPTRSDVMVLVYPNGWQAAKSIPAAVSSPTADPEVFRQVGVGLQQMARQLEAMKRQGTPVAVQTATVSWPEIESDAAAAVSADQAASSVKSVKTQVIKLNKNRSWFQRLGQWWSGSQDESR